MVDFSPILELDTQERGSLQLALAFCAGFLQIDPAQAAEIVKESLNVAPATSQATDNDDAPACAPTAGETPTRVLHVDLSGVRARKLRDKIAAALYCDDLRADLVDRATSAIVAGLATKSEINRMLASAQRSAKENTRRGVGPDRAWLVFFPYLKAIYERNGCAFPKLTGPLEAEPDSIRARREDAERLQARVSATLQELDK